MNYYVELSHCFPCGRLLSLDSRGYVIKPNGHPTIHTAWGILCLIHLHGCRTMKYFVELSDGYDHLTLGMLYPVANFNDDGTWGPLEMFTGDDHKVFSVSQSEDATGYRVEI